MPETTIITAQTFVGAPVPAVVAKALLVWFHAPHAMAMEDVCALHDWFGACPAREGKVD